MITKQKIAQWRNGGEGFIQFVNDNVYMKIYKEGSDISTWHPIGELPMDKNPLTGRSYREMWLRQQDHIVPALEMFNGKFIHRLIILCWMRGEGKSAIACLIQMWKFFCWPAQQIVLGANSKDQTKFVHYDIIRDTIMNSPNLLMMIGGQANIKEKEISLLTADGKSGSAIRAISSFSGIVSNITGYTFSEMFDMKNPKFFNQLDGSTRNVPNALGVIDSTVSSKSHILYNLYEKSDTVKDLFFSYRCSPDADMDDYYHPYMSQEQLDSYRIKMDPNSFAQYFKNTWESGSARYFSDAEVEAINYTGVNNQTSNFEQLKEALVDIQNTKAVLKNLDKGSDSLHAGMAEQRVGKIGGIISSLNKVDSVVRLVDNFGIPKCANVVELEALGELYQTNWSIHAGLDRADPMAADHVMTRTVLTLTAKGLPGSRQGYAYYTSGKEAPYIYVTIGVIVFKSHEVSDIQKTLLEMHIAVDGIDTFCSERWGAWDLPTWCVEQGISAELISPTYEKQRACFGELYNLITQGRYKCPLTYVPGSREDDLIKEEMRIFTHDSAKKWFGSPEKEARGGIQDDAMYSLGWGIYGGREYNPTMFRRRGRSFEGLGYTPPVGLYGEYKV